MTKRQFYKILKEITRIHEPSYYRSKSNEYDDYFSQIQDLSSKAMSIIDRIDINKKIFKIALYSYNIRSHYQLIIHEEKPFSLFEKIADRTDLSIINNYLHKILIFKEIDCHVLPEKFNYLLKLTSENLLYFQSCIDETKNSEFISNNVKENVEKYILKHKYQLYHIKHVLKKYFESGFKFDLDSLINNIFIPFSITANDDIKYVLKLIFEYSPEVIDYYRDEFYKNKEENKYIKDNFRKRDYDIEYLKLFEPNQNNKKQNLNRYFPCDISNKIIKY